MEFLLVAAIAAASAAAVYFTLTTLRATRLAQKSLRPLNARPVLLFDDAILVDATEEGFRLIEDRFDDETEIQTLFRIMSSYFPDLETQISDMTEDGFKRLLAVSDPRIAIQIERVSGLTRMELVGHDKMNVVQEFDAVSRRAQSTELRQLRDMVLQSPHLIWKEDGNGKLIWANRSYLALSDAVLGLRSDDSGDVWPDTLLFPGLGTPDTATADPESVRQAVEMPDEGAEAWFDVTSFAITGGVVRYAASANKAVRAEYAKQAFMQTLSKTFAELSVGLAIFDQKRRLTMFNPSLHDMTALPIDFLSSRPSLDMVMDRLRETRKMPEPKDYSTWREQFTALERAAKSGTYTEIWDLPDGQTIRVSGRPHPDGAIAFIFEDISDEVTLSRRFRDEIETGHAVMDALPDAVAVFSPSKTMVLTNAAYDRLWNRERSDLDVALDLRAAMRTWRAGCAPTAAWQALLEFCNAPQRGEGWSDDVILNDGRQYSCNAQLLDDGLTMVRFSSLAMQIRPVSRITAVPTQARVAEG